MLSDVEKAHDPRRLSSCGTVEFPVRPLESARLIWLNNRWFFEHGVDVLDRDIRRNLAAEILGRYAVKSDRKPSDTTRMFEADLYGGTGGADHGGSGRCGMFGGYNAKGIGKTPLVSENVDTFHRTGWLSLAEALRETISSEICQSELPYGAIPIIAIIDTGFSYKASPGEAEDRCAIVVRPNFIRPSHFERSVFFGDAGTPSSHQYRDARRVSEANQTLARSAGLYPDVGKAFTRFAKQLGAARAYRLWQGRCLTSNLSMDGALVDFGAFRSVPSWRKRVGLAGEMFGSEVSQLRAGFASVLYYYAKYSEGDDLTFEVSSFFRDLIDIEDDAFLDACLHGLGVDKIASGDQPHLSKLISAYYAQEQRNVESDGLSCEASAIFEMLSGRDVKGRCDAEVRIARGLVMELDRLERSGLPVSRRKSSAFFEPRTSLNYATLNEKIHSFVTGLVHHGDAEEATERFIEEAISNSIRRWRGLPAHLEILQMATNVISTVFVCRDLVEKRIVLHLEGPLLANSILVFGQLIPVGCSTICSDQRSSRRGWVRKVILGMDGIIPALRALGVDTGDRLKPFCPPGTEVSV